MDLNQGPPGKEKKPIPLRLQDPAKSEKPEQVVKKKKKTDQKSKSDQKAMSVHESKMFQCSICNWADDKQSKARNSDGKYRQMALVGFGT